MIPHVTHTTPLHDHLCRCPTCKPPLVSTASDARVRIRVATFGMGLAAVALIAARAGGFVS